jgi:uncharacterized protein (DUF1499 family)
MIDPFIKRKYNLVYKLKKKGFNVSSRTKTIVVNMQEYVRIVNDSAAFELVKKHKFTLKTDKKLKLF